MIHTFVTSRSSLYSSLYLGIEILTLRKLKCTQNRMQLMQNCEEKSVLNNICPWEHITLAPTLFSNGSWNTMSKSRFILIFKTMPRTDSSYLDDCLNLHGYHHHSCQLCSTETMDLSTSKVTLVCERNKGFSAVDPGIWKSFMEIGIIMNTSMFRAKYKTHSFEITSPQNIMLYHKKNSDKINIVQSLLACRTREKETNISLYVQWGAYKNLDK